MSATKTAVASFDELGLSEPILLGVKEAGFVTPTPVQGLAIPTLLEGKDATVMAATGTGKTAAYGLPALDRIARDPSQRLLVLAPTRELASQISDELYRLGRNAGLRSCAIYGGRSYDKQLQALSKGVEMLVATPGRLLDLLDSRRIKNFHPSMVVLDEADEMLDLGFLDDIKRIFAYLPEERQTCLFSATLPAPIQGLMKSFQKNPVLLKALGAGSANTGIEQRFYVVRDDERDDAAVRLIEFMEPEKCILFCRTRDETDRLTGALLTRGFAAAPLHGDIDQTRRERTIREFRSSRVRVLVATDVAARGLDVADVTHVFNYHIPGNSDSYIHRVGRTGRAGKKGLAITFVAPSEMHRLRQLKHSATTLEAAVVPGLSDMRQRSEHRLAEKVRQTQADEAAMELVDRLGGDMDLREVAARALQLLLAHDAPSGPEHIGWDAARLKDWNERPQGGSGYRGGKSRSLPPVRNGRGRPDYRPSYGGRSDGGRPEGSRPTGKSHSRSR